MAHSETANAETPRMVREDPIIAPSILAADFSQLGEEIKKVPNADWLHIDIMDGHFVPNLSFGPDITKTVRRISDKPLDIHLMIEDPHTWFPHYVAAGAHTIIFHVEATGNPVALARDLRSRGVRAGLSLRPGTAIEPYLDVLEEFDEVLVMSVEPGFGGQSFMPDQLEKVRVLRQRIDSRGLDVTIEIDGGISRKTIGEASAAGCDSFVAGSAVFGAEDPKAEVDELRKQAIAARS